MSRRISGIALHAKPRRGRPPKHFSHSPPTDRRAPEKSGPSVEESSELLDDRRLQTSSTLEDRPVLEGLGLLHHAASPTKLLDLSQSVEPRWKPDPSDQQVNLPPVSEWTKLFPHHNVVRERVYLRNPTTADVVAEAFVPEGSKGKVIVETFPGNVRSRSNSPVH